MATGPGEDCEIAEADRIVGAAEARPGGDHTIAASRDGTVAAPDDSPLDPATSAAPRESPVESVGSTGEGAAPVEPVRLVLVRHGESNVTVNRTIGGHRTCSGLSALGRRQAERLRNRLSETNELGADVVITSHFARARETAEIVAPALGDLPLFIDDDFGEHDPGPEIDGMSFDGYVARFGTPDWHGDPHVGFFPGGETTAQFHLRVGAAVSRTVSAYPGATIVVFCHGGVVDAVMRQLMRMPPTGSFELQTVNTSLTEFQRVAPDRWRLVRYNDAAHLAGLPASTR